MPSIDLFSLCLQQLALAPADWMRCCNKPAGARRCGPTLVLALVLVLVPASTHSQKQAAKILAATLSVRTSGAGPRRLHGAFQVESGGSTWYEYRRVALEYPYGQPCTVRAPAQGPGRRRSSGQRRRVQAREPL